jgi:hypothetical protein
MDKFILDVRFSRCHSDPNVYTKKIGIHLIILFLCVDGLILTSSDPKLLTHVKSNLKKKLEMTDLGYLHFFLASKYCKPRNDFFVPSLSMIVTSFTVFTWMILNQPLLPSSMESNFLPLVLLPKLMPLCTIN